MRAESLFEELYHAGTEEEVDQVLHKFDNGLDITWHPYGDNLSNFGVMEAQQASPIPALVEKLTNSIDAILMKRCFEEGIDPQSTDAPSSVESAIESFFPNASSWDLTKFRKHQAEDIQIIADGPVKNSSLVIYDNGEGQHPDRFADTFLSLLRGNKTKIQFVQGKYNMGGAGAIAFCGKRRYQLLASKRYDNSGDFGFTLVRKHPLTEEEKKTMRATWYEYITVDGVIPSYPTTSLDLGLHNRKFTTGTVIKLYSYQLPPGSKSVISRDLNQSINEYLFEPALPIYTIDKPERYPKDRNLERDLFGLKRRLEDSKEKYIEESFTENYSEKDIGTIKLTAYVFKAKIEDKSVKESKSAVRREFFKNDMSVALSLNGQVHGSFTREFISRSLKYQLLKDYLLIHVDCTELDLEFRNELFMASRDRVKSGEETSTLRRILTNMLTKGRLKDIYRQRRASISSQSDNTQDILKDFSKNLPLNSNLMSLLNQTFKLDKQQEKKTDHTSKSSSKHQNRNEQKETPFVPQRFPSSFKVDKKTDPKEGIPVIKIPFGGEKTIKFSTDVEDKFFDRIDEPGALQLGLLDATENENTGGDRLGNPKDISQLFNIGKSSPDKGIIRVDFNPTQNLNVGDSVRVNAKLSSIAGEFDSVFLIKISDKEDDSQKKTKTPQPELASDFGLPNLEEVYEKETEGKLAWEILQSQGIEIDYAKVMIPITEGDKLDTIYVNMDCSVLKKYKSTCKTEEQLKIANRRYISTVYFHTLFLYMISKNMNISFEEPSDNQGPNRPIDLSDYLQELFDNYYSEFLLNFEMDALMESLSD